MEKNFAAHDVGTYPLANGQTYQEDMPVEETGNMLIMTTAIAIADGNADYAAKHWETLTIWSNYLAEEGLDPENQLCTEDFAGHLAHNANLSAKAIMAIAGYGRLAKMLNKPEEAKKYTEMAKKWLLNGNVRLMMETIIAWLLIGRILGVRSIILCGTKLWE